MNDPACEGYNATQTSETASYLEDHPEIFTCDGAEQHGSCSWCLSEPLYVEYHHRVWGRPQRDAQALFASLCLEGQQAGLSWITVLRKKAEYDRAFHDFQPEKVADMTDADIDQCMTNAGLIRHRPKLNAIVTNARAWLRLEAEERASEWIWSFVEGQPLVNRWETLSEVPAKTDTSERLSKALKKRGFAFVGPTTAYAFMQASGLVNDHLIGCPLWAVCQE